MRYLILIIALFLLAGVSVDLVNVLGSGKPLKIFSSSGFVRYHSLIDQDKEPSDDTLQARVSFDPYENINLEAKAAVVLDIQNDTMIFEKKQFFRIAFSQSY